MPPRSQLRRNLLHIAADLAALASDPDDLEHGFDLLTRSYGTPAADAARAALRCDPHIAPLLAERYWGQWPAAQELLKLPAGSLGRVYAEQFGAQGLGPLPEPVLAASSTADDLWLHQRVRHTHDLWHVVTGFPANSAGEAALNAFNCMQLRWPGSTMLLGADLMHRCLTGPEPDQPDVGLAVAFGLQLGARCQPLLAKRWEEGWQRPLVAWREQLGIAALLQDSPFGPPR